MADPPSQLGLTRMARSWEREASVRAATPSPVGEPLSLKGIPRGRASGPMHSFTMPMSR